MSHDHDITCQDLLGNLSSLIDGDLPDDACQELKRHMAGCQNCKLVFDTMTRTIYLYQCEAKETEVPVDVKGRLFEALNLDDLLKPKE